jgi:hypothetical protein
MKTKTLQLGNSQSMTIPSPTDPPLAIQFTGTDPAHISIVTLGTIAGTTVWPIYDVTAIGSPGHTVYGAINLVPYSDMIDIQHGVTVSNGNLSLGTMVGGKYTLDGNSVVTNNSTLTTYGGRYQVDPVFLNGKLTVANNSSADFSHGTLTGSGSVHIEDSSAVTMKTVLAGLHVDVDNGGKLSLLYPGNSVGMIHEEAGAQIYFGMTPMAAPNVLKTVTSEIFHEASGMLDLLDQSNTQVASVQFTPGSREYVSHVSAMHMYSLEITTTPIAGLGIPTTFTH